MRALRMGSLVLLGAMVAAGCAGGSGSGGRAAMGGWIDSRPTNSPETGSGRKYAMTDGAPMTTTIAPGAGGSGEVAAGDSGTTTMTESGPAQPGTDAPTVASTCAGGSWWRSSITKVAPRSARRCS